MGLPDVLDVGADWLDIICASTVETQLKKNISETKVINHVLGRRFL